MASRFSGSLKELKGTIKTKEAEPSAAKPNHSTVKDDSWQEQSMDPGFAKLVESLEPKFQALVSMAPVNYGGLPQEVPIRGVYLFSEGTDHLYVGRTNRLRERLRGHCIPSGTHFTATFAFRIARKTTGRIRASYSKSGSRAALLGDSAFASAFEDAKRRIASMDLRFVAESDQTLQALLEIYAATVLKTPYNDFDNH